MLKKIIMLYATQLQFFEILLHGRNCEHVELLQFQQDFDMISFRLLYRI